VVYVSAPYDKLCIQKKIKKRISEIRYEHRMFIIILGVTIFGYYLFWRFYERSVFLDFLIQFTAGVDGILIGFSLERYVELYKRIRISEHILDNILVELHYNLDLVKNIKPIIQHTSDGRVLVNIDFFDLFQTNVWDMFSSRLELKDIEILFDLGRLYHNLKLFNEGMRLESMGGELTAILQRNPKFLEYIEDEIKGVIYRIENVKL